VRSFADTTGTPRATRLLAAARAQVVVDRLVADGVAADRIQSSSMGSKRFVQEPLESHPATISIQAEPRSAGSGVGETLQAPPQSDSRRTCPTISDILPHPSARRAAEDDPAGLRSSAANAPWEASIDEGI